ncbi:multidrug resistance-associated ABC transporter [Pholiota conissans]|uniref:Multidrug resistance-associated ABC transporter n=1 Tax=Pholiota conissans TaxID=109636 RepID=A0A9P5YUU2_9AGAR|nr:multidrug resistance-associated ABC transporter [Pholiota conissans]
MMEHNWRYPMFAENRTSNDMKEYSWTSPLEFPSRETLVIPFATALVFVIVQGVRGLVNAVRPGKSVSAGDDEDNDATEALTSRGWLQNRIENLGGRHIFLYACARLVGCFILLGITFATLDASDTLKKGVPLSQLLSKHPELFSLATFAYSSTLAVISLTANKWSTSATRYNVVLLLITFATYVQRDLWPLATYTQQPTDIAEGSILWFKIGSLFATAVVIPLFVPRRYIPVDPKDPMPVINDEQTCSLFSLVLYTFLDPVILLGSRVAHLKYDQLPPLSDTDYSKNLTKYAFPHLDAFRGAKRLHLFFGLMRVFRKEYAALGSLFVLQALALLVSPIAVYHILSYLETGGHGADNDIRPWFWIFCMFLGPSVNSLALQRYFLISTRVCVRCEALITQLIFEHSLRVRLKAENSSEKSIGDRTQETSETTFTTSETVSEAGRSAEASDDRDSATTTTAVSRDSSKDSSSKPPTAKGKVKAQSNIKDDTAGKKNDNLIGKINNMVTTDLTNIVDSRDFLTLVLFVPLQITLCITFLYQILGWSAFVGLAFMVALFPIPGYIAKLTQDVQRQRMKMTDARVQDITEAVNVIRMIKLFGWEGRMADRIKEKRNNELVWLWKSKVLQTCNSVVGQLIPAISMVASYAAYTIVMDQVLTPSKIFSSITVFSLLRVQLHRISYHTNAIIQGKVSLDRVHDFLRNAELLDTFAETGERLPSVPESVLKDPQAIGFNNAEFSWSLESNDGSLAPSSRKFRLRINGELIFKRNCINLIVGPTGSGKTSLLMALLGEMHFIRTTADSWFNLPRDEGVAYAAQESWVQNETIRENILFGNPYDEVRYRKVLRQCALEKDMELFEAGDKTEVGERGLTLSGGQKARVTLARALYSPAKIILLDDVFAALDVHTSTWIIEWCFKGDLVKDRTILLITHSIALASPVAKFIVSIGLDGSIKTQGTPIEDSLEHGIKLSAEAQHDREALELANDEYDASSSAPATKVNDGKLIVSEEISEGRVTWKSMKLFLKGLGGDYPLFFYSVWITAFLLTDWVYAFQSWFLGYWGSQYETHLPSEVNVFYYLGQYTLIITVMMIITTLSSIFFIFGSMRASRTINAVLVESILGSTLGWLDKTPTARMIARCTQDVQAVDGPIPQSFTALAEIAMILFTRIVVILIFAPVFFAPGLAVAALGLYLGNVYLKAQLSVKREMSNARSPLLAHFSASISGIISVRAYGAQNAFKEESLRRIDHYVRIARTSYNLGRWISLRIDLLGALFTISLASYLVYGGRPLGAANTGFTLNMCLDFTAMILWWVRILNDLEVQANSLERIQHYIDIEHEPKPTEEGKPPAAWPTSGDLHVEHLSARYSQNGPAVLHGLNFTIKSGERIGVVGRTGSGKTSLTLSLLRCIITEGNVFYDGLPTHTVNLDALRSHVTIIPQTPELLSGTLRRNLDPFEQHDDATLNNALRDAGLFSLQEDMDEARITLDTDIASGGNNLSVGQRQILALARAIVRRSKLLILDEATSAIDYKTDAVIQTTLRHRLPSDVTVITVAHRLQTVMDSSRIMVLDAGRIVEFDTPAALLQMEDGMLKALVDGSGDKAMLYAMVEGDSVMSRNTNGH